MNISMLIKIVLFWCVIYVFLHVNIIPQFQHRNKPSSFLWNLILLDGEQQDAAACVNLTLVSDSRQLPVQALRHPSDVLAKHTWVIMKAAELCFDLQFHTRHWSIGSQFHEMQGLKLGNEWYKLTKADEVRGKILW